MSHRHTARVSKLKHPALLKSPGRYLQSLLRRTVGSSPLLPYHDIAKRDLFPKRFCSVEQARETFLPIQSTGSVVDCLTLDRTRPAVTVAQAQVQNRPLLVL